MANKQLILELGAYVGFSGVSFSRVSFHLNHGFQKQLANMQHLYEAHPDSKYPAEWSETDEPGTRAGYVSLEKSEVYAKTAQGAFDLAGLGKVVKVCPNYLSSVKSCMLGKDRADDSSSLDLLPPTFAIYAKPSICLNHFNSIWFSWII